MSNFKDVVFDCAHPWMLGHWWAETLGYQVRPHTEEDLAKLRARGIERPEDDDSIAVDPVGEQGPTFWFEQVPEAKVVKNRVHIDVYGDVETLLARGATLVDTLSEWAVLADPEGNEFCVFVDDRG